ncbi:MAG: hypothetical protein HYZ53_20925 [Planctomycetes bacterium]|nr:hypothetical protein [Planctomycetota bacterium]
MLDDYARKVSVQINELLGGRSALRGRIEAVLAEVRHLPEGCRADMIATFQGLEDRVAGLKRRLFGATDDEEAQE